MAILVSASLAVAGLPGCQSIAVNAGNVATLRVVDAASDTAIPGLDIYENGSAIVYNIGFPRSTNPIAFAPGTYSIAARVANGGATLASSNASLANMHAYTAIFSGSLASLQENIYADQNTAAPSGQVAIRVINQASRIAAVDVYLVPSTGKLATTNPITVGLGSGANSGYLNVPADTYTIAVVPTGTTPSTSNTSLLANPQLYGPSGAVRTIVIVDQQLVTSPGVQALVLEDFSVNGTTS